MKAGHMRLGTGYYVYEGDTYRSRKTSGSIKRGSFVKVKEILETGRICVDTGSYALTVEEFSDIFGDPPDRITDARNKAVVLKTQNKDYPLNVQIWTSVGAGEPYYYCGNGQFIKDESEISEVVLKYRAVEIERRDLLGTKP